VTGVVVVHGGTFGQDPSPHARLPDLIGGVSARVAGVRGRSTPWRRRRRDLDRAELPSCWLVICGDGPLAGELHAQAAGDPRVIITGFREDPRPICAAADVMALASWEEGFGQVLLESACAGVPAVVVADAGLGSTVEGWG